jgi:tripartite ATP-independent transporter DctM subunit
MSVDLITLIIWASLLLLMFTGFSIAFSMIALAVTGYLVFIGPQALPALYSAAYRSITLDIFIAIPLFIFTAALLQESGVGEGLYDVMYKWMAGLRGGLAIGTILICTVIAATTGLGGTGTILMGLLAYPEMRKRGYEKRLAVGCIPVGGALGPLIPPSVPAILVGSLGGLSTGKLFMAGVIPGVICSLFFCLYIGIRCLLNPALGPAIPVSERADWKTKLVSLRGVAGAVTLIILILGGIYSGAFTPSEAGGIGAAGTIIISILYRKFNWRNLKSAMLTTLKVNGMVMWIVIGGAAFSSLCGITGITQFTGKVLTELPLSPYGILLVMLLIVFIEGMFIDNTAIIMISLPVMLPVAIKLGFDPLWFAFLFTMDVIIGMVTPPFGYNLFYMRGLGHADVSMKDIYISVMPYIPLFILGLVLCILFPQLALWIPSMMTK